MKGRSSGDWDTSGTNVTAWSGAVRTIQPETDWSVQDANTTDWRADIRIPSGGDTNVEVNVVTSFNGRFGTVVSVSGDYESQLVTIAPPISTARPWGDVRLYLTNLSGQVDTAQSTADSAAGIASNALPKSGGTMTGAIVLAGDGTAPLNPVSRQQLDAIGTTATNAMPKSGGTFTGSIVLSGDATAPLQPASKQQIDAIGTTATNAMPKSGGTFTGNVLMSSSALLQPATDKVVGLGAVANRWANVYGDVLNVGASNVPVRSGTGTPEGAVTAPVSSLFLRSDGGAGTTLYSKQSGAGNTGWVAFSDPTSAVQAAMSAEDNLILNGSMEIWQRGLNFSVGSGALAYTADRWHVIAGTGAALTVQQQLHDPGDPQRASVLINRTTAGAAISWLGQKIENVRTANGQTVTLSFSVFTAIAGTLSVGLNQTFGTGGSPSAGVSSPLQNVTITPNIWDRKTITYNMPSITGKTLGTNGDSSFDLYIGIPNSLGTGNWFITNVDLRLGPTAPATFLRRPQQQELALCQRYYQVYSQLGIQQYSAAGGTVKADYVFPVQMRATPTIAFSAGSTVNSSALVTTIVDNKRMQLSMTITATGVGNAIANVSADAEL